MTVPLATLRDRLRLMEESLLHIADESKRNGGRIRRDDLWRKQYLSFPYLVGAPNDRLAHRFRDIWVNTAELNEDGKIGILPVDSDEGFFPKFGHMLEEYGVRGGMPTDVMFKANRPIRRYFEDGEPVAMKMFRGYSRPKARFIVKYGQRQFLEPMLHTGRLRICPATYYNNSTHNDAVKDDEIHRTFYIPTFRERLRGVHHVEFEGHRLTFGDDDIVVPVVAPDYFLFSLCDQIYYRLPTDFGADATVIISNPDLFIQRTISAFLARWPEWEPVCGPVTYYDPYRDYSKMRVHEMSKHFGYAYQREVRIVLRARRRFRTSLGPEFLDIGPMTDYADLVHICQQHDLKAEVVGRHIND